MAERDVTSLSLIEIAGAIREGRVSSQEATRASLDRLDTHGRALNAIAAIDGDRALAAAATADAERKAGRLRGPLHGVPLAHKDMFYRAGRVSACGTRILADFVPDHTSTALARLDAAGALDIARLAMVEFALGPTGHNEIVGTPRNPWNPAHITGGSSSGPAVAVAGRMIHGTLGSDTGGSIRVPASCCGIVGIKPSYGRVSRYGALPLSHSLDHVGPMARNAADCALLLGLIAGHDPLDPTSSERPVPDYLAEIEAGARGLRIAVPETYFYDGVDAEVARLARASLEVYRAAGATIVPVTIPGIERANPLVMLIIAAEAAAVHTRWIAERPGDYGRQTLGRLLPGLAIPAPRYVEALSWRRRLMETMAEAVFAKADALHVPVLSMPVPTIAESDIAANPGFGEFLVAFAKCARPFNYLGLPALSVPCGFTSNGLPTAFQLVGRPFDEALLFRLARAYERDTDWTRRAPAL